MGGEGGVIQQPFSSSLISPASELDLGRGSVSDALLVLRDAYLRGTPATGVSDKGSAGENDHFLTPCHSPPRT